MANYANCSGLDGSIAYEANRAENAGLFVNDTLGFVSSMVHINISATC
jgi:hypothetical protein